MYDGIKFKVKTSKGYMKEFIFTLGVKQGCNLTPSLANIFQNDMPLIFDEFWDPVELEGNAFNSLSWADDLVYILHIRKRAAKMPR